MSVITNAANEQTPILLIKVQTQEPIQDLPKKTSPMSYDAPLLNIQGLTEISF